MKRILFIILLVALLGFAVIGQAQADFAVEWTPPTTNTDGSELTDLAGYTLVWINAYPCAGDICYDVGIENIDDPEATTATFDLTGYVILTISAYNYNGIHSVYTETIDGYYY